jgi:hypothetical protein
MTKVCILDPACHIPSLKTLFPDAEYFAHEPDSFFRYPTTPHPTKEENLRDYGFSYRTDWENIKSSEFSTIFIVAPLLDYFDSKEKWNKNELVGMRDRISELLLVNSFEKVVVFDVYDYDYEPNTIGCTWKATFFFKRYYNKKKDYQPNVFPFPFMMFLKPCVLGLVLNTKPVQKTLQSIPVGLWVGGLYTHTDTTYDIVRDRLGIYQQIHSLIYTLQNVPQSEFINTLQQFKIGIDLIGVGSPNKRTFEILHSGSLLMSMCNDLKWPFDEGDEFSEETLFSTAEEFRTKYETLLLNADVYNKCMEKQNTLIEKYFNQEWLSLYIKKCVFY